MEEWTVHYFDKRLNSEEVSRIFASKEDALRHACDLELKNCITHNIRGPNEQRSSLRPSVFGADSIGPRSTLSDRE